MATGQAGKFSRRQLQLDGIKQLPPSIPLAYPNNCVYLSDSFCVKAPKNPPNGPEYLEYVPEAIKLLTSIGDKPVAVVSICGPYRSGKSYFLSRVLGYKEAFKLGHSAHACTRGIWLSTYILECDEFVLLFLDTEGADAIGEAEISENFTTSLLALTTLMSSLLIYNSEKVPKKSDLNQIKYFIRFTESILSNETCSSTELSKIFPSFVWLLRNVDLPMTDEDEDEDEGKEMEPTSYIMKYVFKKRDKNKTGEKLLKYFPNFKCMKISTPKHDPKVLSEYDEEPSEFNKEVQAAIDYILSSTKAKIAPNGTTIVTGSSLAVLLEQYAMALKVPDKFPNLEMSWEVVIKQQLTKYLESLIEDYVHKMSEQLRGKLPMEYKSLMANHQDTLTLMQKRLAERIRSFIHRVTNTTPEFKEYNLKLMQRIVKYKQDGVTVESGELFRFVTNNETESRKCCESLCHSLSQRRLPLEKLISEYKQKAVGPAKEKVYQQKIAVIPGKPTNLRIVSKTLNSITLEWKTPNIHPKSVQYYHAQIVSKGGWLKPETIVESFVKNMTFTECRPATSYTIRICASSIDKTRKSEFAEIEVLTDAGPPNQPIVRSFNVVNCTCGKIVCKAPKPVDCNGSRVKSMITRLVINDNKNYDEEFKLTIKNGDEYIINEIKIPGITSSRPAKLVVFWRNSVGVSTPSDQIVIESTEFVPGSPQKINTVGRTSDQIKVRFKEPGINPAAVHSYSIEMEKKNEGKKFLKLTKHLSFVAKDLKSDTEYTFYVTAMNKKGKSCGTSRDLICETKLSKVAAGFAGAGLAVAGVAGAPVAGALVAPVTSVTLLAEGIENKDAGSIVGGLLGLAATPITAPIGLVAGLLGAPLGGIGGAVAAKVIFADSDDDIEDSDNENIVKDSDNDEDSDIVTI